MSHPPDSKASHAAAAHRARQQLDFDIRSLKSHDADHRSREMSDRFFAAEGTEK